MHLCVGLDLKMQIIVASLFPNFGERFWPGKSNSTPSDESLIELSGASFQLMDNDIGLQV